MKRLISLILTVAMMLMICIPAMGAPTGGTVMGWELEGGQAINVGETFDVTIKFNEMDQSLIGIKMAIGFDGHKMSLESITCDSSFKDWMTTPQDGKVVNDTVILEKFTLTETNVAHKDIATLHFKANQAGNDLQIGFVGDGNTAKGVSLTSMQQPNGIALNASAIETGISINIISSDDSSNSSSDATTDQAESSNRDSNHESHQEKQEPEETKPKDTNKEQIKIETSPVLKDTKGHWAEGNINKLITSGAISGYPDGTFKPDARIKRAEFATILVKAFNLEAKTGKVFADTANHWGKDAIATAAAYGIVGGYDDTTFGPEDDITREQMALMIVRAAKLDTAATGKSFEDGTAISGWAANAVNTAFENGIISGYPDNTFKPQGNAKRAEAVTVIVNALK